MQKNHILYYKKEVKNILLLLPVCIISYFTILNSNFLYSDDGLRIFTHTSINQGVHGRPIADILYALISDNTFMDASPFSQIIALLFILCTGILIVSAFLDEQNNGTYSKYCFVLLFTMLPINYSIISYRYDSFGMGCAIFLAGLAFFIQRKNISIIRCLLSSILLFLTLSTYQPMCGVYFSACLILFSQEVLHTPTLNAIKRVIYRFIPPIIGGIIYIPIYLQAKSAAKQPFCGLPHHPYSVEYNSIVSSTLIENIYFNTATYFNTVSNYITHNTISYCIAIFITILLFSITTYNIKLYKKILSLVGISISFLSCGILLIILNTPIFAPRTLIPLCTFILCILAFTFNNSKKIFKTILILTCFVCIFSSVTVLTITGNAFRDQEKLNNIIVLQPLTEDLSNIIQKEREISIYINSYIPIAYSLSKLQKKYPYIEHQSGFFALMQIISMLPIKLDLLNTVNYTKFNQENLIISRLGYDIYRISPQVYGIKLNSGYVPTHITRYQIN